MGRAISPKFLPMLSSLALGMMLHASAHAGQVIASAPYPVGSGPLALECHVANAGNGTVKLDSETVYNDATFSGFTFSSAAGIVLGPGRAFQDETSAFPGRGAVSTVFCRWTVRSGNGRDVRAIAIFRPRPIAAHAR